MDIHPTVQAQFDSLDLKIETLRDEVRTSIEEMRGMIEGMRLQLVPNATPEEAPLPSVEPIPIDSLGKSKPATAQELPPGLGAKAEEFAPEPTAPTPAVIENGVTALQAEAPEEAPTEISHQ